MTENKYTTLWEIEKPYNDRLVKSSAIIVGIVNLIILITGVIICSVIIQFDNEMLLRNALLFGYGMGVFAMFVVFIITIRYTKIRL